MTTLASWSAKLQLTFAAAILALITLGLFSFRTVVSTHQREAWVRHTHEVIERLQDANFAMESVESSARGFLLTGRASSLDSYHAALLREAAAEAAVRRLTADNPRQQLRLASLARLSAERARIAAAVLVLPHAPELRAAVDAIEQQRGELIAAQFQPLVRELESEELRSLTLRNSDAERAAVKTNILLLLGALLGLMLVSAAAWNVHRGIARRAVVEEALRVSEEQYRMLIQGFQDYAIVMLDLEGTIITWNSGAERMLGASAEQMIGSHFAALFPSEARDRGRPAQILASAEANGPVIDQGLRKRRDGSWFRVRSTYTARRAATGELRGFTVISRDLSESSESGAKYRGLLEAAPDAMIVVNQAGEIVLLNVQAEKQFGYHRDELVDQPVTGIIPEGFAERLIADGTRSAADALAQQIGTGIELIGRRKDGSAFPIEIMLSPLQNEDGILVTAAIRDISVRKAAETQVLQMESRYRGLLEAAPDAMVVVNHAGEIVLLNLQAEKQFGYHRDELVGAKVKIIIPDGFAERLLADGLRSAEEASAQQIGTGIELTARRKDGTEFPIELMLSPLESPDGILVTAAIRNISARKDAEALLLQKVAELYRSNEELGQFAYVASHDLQEPLRMVASYTQLLSKRYKGKLDPDADEFIAFAVDGASRMQRLIRDLLAYSRVGTKGKQLLESSSEVALAQALLNLRGAIVESGALVTHDPLPTVMADEAQLVQLFQNLVGNAIKYQNAGVPQVHVSATPSPGRKWLFTVKDNGLGIDEQYFERIFGMFQRLHKRDEFAGTGIGLAICKKIVERHGGSISVESQLGHGSTFLFALAEQEGGNS